MEQLDEIEGIEKVNIVPLDEVDTIPDEKLDYEKEKQYVVLYTQNGREQETYSPGESFEEVLERFKAIKPRAKVKTIQRYDRIHNERYGDVLDVNE